MDNNENNQNNGQPQDLSVNMQNGSELLKKVMNKTKTIKSGVTGAKDKIWEGAKLKAVERRAKGTRKIAKGTEKTAKGGAAVGAGTALTGIGAGLKAAAVTSLAIPGVGPGIYKILDAASKPILNSGKEGIDKGSENLKSGAKSINNGIKDMDDAKKIEETGEDPGGSKEDDGGDSGTPILPKPRIPDKFKIIKDKLHEIIKKRAIKIGLIIIVIALIFILILDLMKDSTVDKGSFIDGDESNVPYVIDSQIMNSLTITSDGAGGFKYAFTDSEGNIVDLDTALDNALKTLKDNGSTALSDMGKDDEERKAFLKKLIQAEIATQYPDLSISGGSGVTRSPNNNSGGVNDYCVKTDEPDSMPVLNEAQLLEIVEKSGRSEEAKATIREVLPSIVKAQEKYKVNAVFCLAVTLQESGWGIGWEYIDKSTYNWTSVRGKKNGGYLGKDGEYWNVYTSWEDCTNSWFELIAENENGNYFSAGDYTCNTIGNTYCTDPPNWGGAVSEHIETFYGYLGITPNVAGTNAGDTANSTSNGSSNTGSSNNNSSSTSSGSSANSGSSNGGSTSTTTNIADLTLDEKIYQMILLGVTVSDGSTYSNSKVGGFFLYGGSNYDSLTAMGSSSKVAPFIATDDEGGYVTRAADNTPSAKSYGDSQDYTKLRNDEVSKTNLLLSKGINFNLSPVADVTSSGTMYSNGRSYSSDPEVVKKCIQTAIKARASVDVNGTKLSSTLKHYPGYPNSDTNSDNGVVHDSRSVNEINKVISVFKSGISDGAQSVMTSNVIYDNLDSANPASLSSTIISGLRSNYNGIIMTDDLDASATSGISDRYKKAIMAGNDIILLNEKNLNTAFNQIKSAVESGEISEDRINESVERILNLKKKNGITSSSGSAQGGNTQNGGNASTNADIGWLWTISFENFNAYLYHHNNPRVSYTDLYVEGYITEDRKNYIVTTAGGLRYAGPGVQLESNINIFAEFGVDVNTLSVGSLIDADIVEQVSQKAYNNLLDIAQSDSSSQGVTLNETQLAGVTDGYYLNGPNSGVSNFASLYTQYGDSEALANNYMGFSYADSVENANSRSKCAWALFHFGEYHSTSPDFNEMVANGEINTLSSGGIPSGGSKGDIQGRIKIQRKDENGNTRILSYTDPKTFNSMISSKNASVMNYYTLQPSSGSGISGNILNMQTDGSMEENAAAIYAFFLSKGATKEGAAGMLGNMQSESGFMPNNLENSYESSWGFTDESFTADVDSGAIDRDQFVNYNGCEYGYGIVQWTSSGIKGELYDLAKLQGTSIADLATQCECLYQQLTTKYTGLWDVLVSTNSVEEAADKFLEEYERPASYNYSARRENANYWYDQFADTITEATLSSYVKDKSSNIKNLSSKEKSSSNNNSSSSNKNSSSSSASSSSSGSQDFFEIAKEVKKYVADNNYGYSQSANPITTEGICCASYVAWVLIKYGYDDCVYPDGCPIRGCYDLATWCQKNNFEQVYNGITLNPDEANLQPGDIVFMGYNDELPLVYDNLQHVQIYAGKNSSGQHVWYSCGGVVDGLDPVKAQPGEDTKSKPRGSDHKIVLVYRVPGGSKTGGKAAVKSLDNFLFIGDSRYSTTSAQIAELGSNIKNEGVGSARIDEWLAVSNSGGKGTVQSTSVDITGTYSGISVQLGANSVYNNVDTSVSQMEEFLNKLKELHPGTPIFVNSCLSVNSNATSSGYTWDVTKMKDCIKEFDNKILDFCNQNSDLYFVDISNGLEDENGFIKSEYESDGLHCNSASAGIFAQNIKDGILSAGATIDSSDDNIGAASPTSTYQLVVANKKETTTTVTNEYSYSHTYSVETSNGHQQAGLGQATSTPSPKTVSQSSTVTYSKTSVDYQAALKNYTLYFDFLWAVLIDTGNREFISSWADLAINGDVTITVFNDVSTSSSTSSVEKGTFTHTEGASGYSVVYDVYNITEVTKTTTKKTDSRPAITNANTWLVKYVNEADTYSEYKGKSKEEITEKTEFDDPEDNIIKLIRSSKNILSDVTSGEHLVDEMLEENEKVNFMIDIYSYIIRVANGKDSGKVKLGLNGLLDFSLFDLSASENKSTVSVLLYDSLNIDSGDLNLLYKVVEQICEPYGDSDENTKRKKYVTAVILNRTLSSKFPNSIKSVVKQKYQFENLSFENFDSDIVNKDIEISDSTKEAVDYVVIGGDCTKHSVYFAKPSTAQQNNWDETYTLTLNDGDKSDNSFNYYTTDEIDEELTLLETTVSRGTTRPSMIAQKIIDWANSQVGKKEFRNRDENKNMSSSNSSPQFVKSAYYEGGLDYISGDIDCSNEMVYNGDGTVNWAKIPETAVIVAENGIASLYVGNGYVVEAGGDTIQKVPIDQSQGAGKFKGWGFACDDQDEARKKLVVKFGSGGSYGQGWTPLEDVRTDGIEGIFSVGDHEYKIYKQGSGSPWSGRPFWGGTIASDGCGPTSVAIILSGYGIDVTPDEIATQLEALQGGGGYYDVWAHKEIIFNNYGIENSGVIEGVDHDRVKNHLMEGKPVMLTVSGNYGPRSTGGHYITLLGYDELEDKAFLGDAAGNPSGWWSLDVVLPAAGHVWYIEGNGGQFNYEN